MDANFFIILFMLDLSKDNHVRACICQLFLKPFPKQQILDSSKLKEFVDNNFKFDENCRHFSNWVENTVGKGEIARHEQFLLFPQCFPKTCTADT